MAQYERSDNLNFLKQMASKYIQKFPIPGSFPDILHDFVREVLRDQPENIYEYGAAYFTALDNVSIANSQLS